MNRVLRVALCGMVVAALLVAGCQPRAEPASGALEVRLSDHRIAIGDFLSLDMTLTSIDIHPMGQSRAEGWLINSPQTAVVDLTQYLDDRKAVILTTDLPAGEYDAVRLVVAGGEGRLQTGATALVEGFSQAAALRFTLSPEATAIILLDVVVESTEDHPGGGYIMNLLTVTTR